MKFQISRVSELAPPCEKAFEGREAWFVKINSLKELISLAEDEGELIISATVLVPQIEIYDDYKE